MIGVLTANFSLYHDLIEVLRRRTLPFVSLTFHDEIPPNVDVVITTAKERHQVMFDNVVTWREGCRAETIVDKALMVAEGKEYNILFGVDPGDTIGIAIYGNKKLLRRFVVQSPEMAVDFIKTYVREMDARQVTVRVGNGARLVRNRMINALAEEPFTIEMVDEADLPGVDDDAVAASMIAMEQGVEITTSLSLEPKEGEIREVQRLSRIKNGNITISKALARKVLRGDITLDEALQLQQEKNHG